MGPYEWSIKRGLIAGVVAGTLAFALPWLLLYLLLFTKRLGNDIDPSFDGAWLGSYFLTSVVGTAAFVSFGTRPRSTVRHNFPIVASVAILCLAVAGLAEGQRYKSEPAFGEKPGDLVMLTVPAVVTGVVLLAWRILRGDRSHSRTMGDPTRK
jgi:hypothetical protein